MNTEQFITICTPPWVDCPPKNLKDSISALKKLPHILTSNFPSLTEEQLEWNIEHMTGVMKQIPEEQFYYKVLVDDEPMRFFFWNVDTQRFEEIVGSVKEQILYKYILRQEKKERKRLIKEVVGSNM
jgi:hypothetical protein